MRLRILLRALRAGCRLWSPRVLPTVLQKRNTRALTAARRRLLLLLTVAVLLQDLLDLLILEGFMIQEFAYHFVQ